MKKNCFISLAILILAPVMALAQSWYSRNLQLKEIYPSNVWTCVEKAWQYHNTGNHQREDMYLKKAEQLTLAAEPFNPKNWPSHWPRTQQALDILRYAPPSAYIYRILGDYSMDHSRNKEAIKYFKMYLNHSYIPDAAYLFTLGNLLEVESLYPQAISVYQELLECIQAKNFHNQTVSVSSIQQRIRRLNVRMEPQIVLVLDMKLQDLPNFLSNSRSIFKEKLESLDRNYVIVKDQVLNRVFVEQKLSMREIVDDMEERARIVKLLNARYILEPSLVKIENMYIFQVKVYKAGLRDPVEIYEYRNENYEFLPSYFQRFALEFQGKQIPAELLIPENSYQWVNETSDEITALAISENGSRVISGCKDGRVYIFNRAGRLYRAFKQQDEIVQVAISPDGNYCAWASIDGRISMAEGGKIIFEKKVKNLVRSISIAENGKFWAYAIDNKIYYLDSKGEIFWTRELPDWAGSIKISQDCLWLLAGTTSGDFLVYNNEGNLAWSAKFGGAVEKIRVSPEIGYASAGLKNNLIHLVSISGTEILKFASGDSVRFLTFNQEILEALTGIWNQWYYFPDAEKKRIWYFSIDKSVKIADSALSCNFYVLAKGKSLLAYTVKWK
ncbi:MAG: WD40 repeat domain-containing protein [Candidatus Omnitrophica bacterium]|nr:WD40 repeat domain-containing protein [Candidatus Omnitrophota bacterium]MCM8828758.1 WD40 repeat domain-containing protein [Candidatus Omnitrophota bacterium]